MLAVACGPGGAAARISSCPSAEATLRAPRPITRFKNRCAACTSAIQPSPRPEMIVLGCHARPPRSRTELRFSGSFLIEDADLDAAVLLARLLVGGGDQRPGVAEAGVAEAAALDPLLDEVLHHRLGAVLRQPQVPRLGPLVAGVAFDDDLLP